MDFAEKLNQFSQRIEGLQDSIQTEEATKTSMIMPFFQMLGYDVFNPLEFIPEYTADVGIKKGEKVDYAIIVDDQPLILIECKSCHDDLSKHGSQLFRYFGTTPAKFGILTNGLNYKFYTDLEAQNKMDTTPFLDVDLLRLKENMIPEIEKFCKGVLDVSAIVSTASELKYVRLIKEWFVSQSDDPSTELVRLVMNATYDGIKNQKAIEKFYSLIKRGFKQFVSDTMSDRIKLALRKEDDTQEAVLIAGDESIEKSKVVTTVEELEAYAIVKALLRNVCDVNRVVYRDTESYFGILFDDNSRKWICRIHLHNSVKYLTLPDDEKKPVRHNIETINDIYGYAEQIEAVCKRFL